VLPAVTIVVTSIGGWLISMRNMMVTTMSEDYVRLAEAKGLSRRRIMYKYAARNAMLPSLSGFAMSLGSSSAAHRDGGSSSTIQGWAACCSRPPKPPTIR